MNAGTTTTERAATVPMADAVGYSSIDCAHAAPVASALVLKNDRLFLLVNERGDVAPPGACGLGLFYEDTRILSEHRLRFAGGPGLLLGSQVPRMYGAQIDLAINDLELGGNPWDPKNVIHVRREMLLDDRMLHRVTLTNYLTQAIDFRMWLDAACDFADIFEVRGWHRPARGEFFAPTVDGRSILFAYRGRDGEVVTSTLRFFDRPTELTPHGASWSIRLAPRGRFVAEWEVFPGRADEGRRLFPSASLEERRQHLENSYLAWRAECSTWRSDVESFDDTLSRAIDDLRALYTDVDGQDVLTAGIPWYSTAFGRDAIIAALQTLPLNPQIARDALRYLARHQGTKEDRFTEEQPGRIMHELRRGEMARDHEIPHLPYYGTIDATPLWLVLLHETWRWTADQELVQELLPNAERALAWIDRYGDLDGDGFVEYASTSKKGLVNQGWKDSSDGVPFPDGRLPDGPIALVEVQGYVCDAKTRMAALYDALGRREDGARLREQASALREHIREAFWIESLGTFALALDGHKQPIPTVTSNAAHLLWSRVPTAQQAARTAQVLMAPDMFSGWGIRTLSAAHPAFNPMSYHDGSVWPHDNGIAVLGMSLYNHGTEALPVVTAMHEAAVEMPFHRLPELFCGLARERGLRPVLYPVSCSPQAWASGAMWMLLQALLGVFPSAPERLLHIRDPILPTFLRELTISDLRIGASRIALQFRRHGTRTLANLLSVDGAPLDVRIELTTSS